MYQSSFYFSIWFQLKCRLRGTFNIIMPVKYVVLKFLFGPGGGLPECGPLPPLVRS
jgi:hypothetical protein